MSLFSVLDKEAGGDHGSAPRREESKDEEKRVGESGQRLHNGREQRLCRQWVHFQLHRKERALNAEQREEAGLGGGKSYRCASELIRQIRGQEEL